MYKWSRGCISSRHPHVSRDDSVAPEVMNIYFWNDSLNREIGKAPELTQFFPSAWFSCQPCLCYTSCLLCLAHATPNHDEPGFSVIGCVSPCVDVDVSQHQASLAGVFKGETRAPHWLHYFSELFVQQTLWIRP